jgi:hypothetical protein
MSNVNDEEALRIAGDARVVVVVGMVDERRAERPAYRIPERIKASGCRVIPVNPGIASSLGERAYAAIAEVPERADVLDVFRGADAIPALADEVLALPEDRRPGCVWLQTGITHPESERRLQEAGMRVVSDRCLGVLRALSRGAGGP